MFACHKLSETSLSLQSHRQLLLPWERPTEIVGLSERGTLAARTRPAADSCGVIHVRRYAAVICVRTGPCWCEASLWNLSPLRLLHRHRPLRQRSLCSSSEAPIVHTERGCVVSSPGFLKVAACVCTQFQSELVSECVHSVKREFKCCCQAWHLCDQLNNKMLCEPHWVWTRLSTCHCLQRATTLLPKRKWNVNTRCLFSGSGEAGVQFCHPAQILVLRIKRNTSEPF